mmetsp:Transcript_10813/g.34578  ORF Transcript_10813/g.34578 Transcript_10813/m.34578 type:complete len:206 (-) Transcript_10813:112-729(-)
MAAAWTSGSNGAPRSSMATTPRSSKASSSFAPTVVTYFSKTRVSSSPFGLVYCLARSKLSVAGKISPRICARSAESAEFCSLAIRRLMLSNSLCILSICSPHSAHSASRAAPCASSASSNSATSFSSTSIFLLKNTGEFVMSSFASSFASTFASSFASSSTSSVTSSFASPSAAATTTRREFVVGASETPLYRTAGRHPPPTNGL